MNRYALAITLLLPNFIHSMELAESKYIIPQNILTHRERVRIIYESTHRMLTDFKPDEKSAPHLICVINQMNSLKLAEPPIKENEIGFFILKKNPSLPLVESFKQALSVAPNNATISIFFARLAAYNDEMSKKSFVSPNPIQASNYLRSLTTDRIVTKNAERNIVIPQQTINENIIPAPGSVGVSEFLQLMNDIADILNDTPEDAELSARLIYHNELNGRGSAVSQ